MTPCTDKELADLAIKFAQIADGVVVNPHIDRETARQVVSACVELGTV
jgi:hypothetical protein